MKSQNHGMKAHKSKCHFYVNSLDYLASRIDGKCIHKTDDKVRAVKLTKVPENVKELQSLLGLVTFYGNL